MSRRLFGTDGVRGLAGTELSAELALQIGAAATKRLCKERPTALIVRDTRESGEMLQTALAAGVACSGGEVLLGGVLPTPAAPLLLRRYQLDLAVVISASHNPYRDNGIKLFGADGFKLSEEAELEIEEDIEREAGQEPQPAPPALQTPPRAGQMPPSGQPPRAGQMPPPAGRTPQPDAIAIGKVRELRGAQEDYLRELQTRFEDLQLHGIKVALDCANGATANVAPEIFKRLGAQVTVINALPDGRNINDRCGSTHMHALVSLLAEGQHHLGFAFDGDGDRVLAVDRNAQVIDGDELIALIAFDQKRTGSLQGGGVAVTVMTNYGFHVAMADDGIEVASTDVGDKQVLQELRARGWSLGGEQSGHIIDLRFNSSGDGISTALQTMKALAGKDLTDRRALKRLPQVLVNVPIPPGGDLSEDGLAAAELTRISGLLANTGRVLLRRSGTEPLMRVMVEAPSPAQAQELCGELAEAVERELQGAAAHR